VLNWPRRRRRPDHRPGRGDRRPGWRGGGQVVRHSVGCLRMQERYKVRPLASAIQQPVQQRGQFLGCSWLSADVQTMPLSCSFWSPTDTGGHPTWIWGSSGRRFKSCQPDTHHRTSEAVFGVWPEGLCRYCALSSGVSWALAGGCEFCWKLSPAGTDCPVSLLWITAG